MAEKCISSYGTNGDIHKTATLNCHSTLIVEHSTTKTTLIHSNKLKIMDNISEISLSNSDGNSCTTFNKNLIDKCNIIENNSNENNKNHINDIDDDGCGSESSDELSCSNNITITSRNDLKNLNLNSTNHQHDTNIIYLETPVIDENIVCIVNSNHDFNKVQSKPKRLSDEFLSSDDDNDIEDDDKIDIDDISGSSSSSAIKLSTTVEEELSMNIIPATSTTPAPTSIDDDINLNNNILHKSNVDDEDDENSNENFIPVVSTSSRDFLDDDIISSSCSNLGECLKDNESQLLIMNDDDEDDETVEPSTSSLSAVIENDVCKLHKYRLTSNNIDRICGSAGDGGSGIASSESTVSYYDNDVQSMDAIERRDFEHEQRLTGGILLRARSLVNNNNKINLEQIKTYNNNSNDCGERNVASDSKFVTTQREQQLTTTPTSSRNCTIRLTKSTAKMNLSATLDNLKDNHRLDKKENKLKLIHLQPSTSNNQNKLASSQLPNITDTMSTSTSLLSSSTITVPILGQRNLLCGKNLKNNKKQLNILYTNSNSNDSLSSDKSYSTSSNHSLPNVSSKSTSNSTINNNNSTSISTLNSCKSIVDKTDEIKMKTNVINSNSSTTVNNNNNLIQNYDIVNDNLYSNRIVSSSVSKESIDEDDDDDDDDDDEDDDDEEDDEDNENFCCSEQQQKQQKERNNKNTKNLIEIDNDNITIRKNLNKSIINSKSVRFNRKHLDIKDSCNYNSNNLFNKTSSTSTSSVSTQSNSMTLATTSASSVNNSIIHQESHDIINGEQQNIDNNFDENPLLNQDNNLPIQSQQQQQQQQHNNHHDNDFDDETWADCEEGSDEEICTCHNNSNLTIDFLNQTTNSVNNEDDLPSKDVDLSSYIQMVSISEDMFLQHHNNLSSDYSLIQRKRKLNDNSTNCNSINGVRINHDHENINSCNNESPTSSSRKRFALDYMSTPRCSQQLSNSTIVSTATIANYSSPTTPSYTSSSPSLIRTPRSCIPTKDNPPPELQNWLKQFQLWSPAERLLAVDRLIENCEPQQVRHMMKVIEPQFQRDFISLLPRELALQVLSYLDPKDLLRAAQTCRSWRFLCDDNLLWKEKCKTAQILTEPTTDRPKRGRAGNMPPISSPWKAAYMRQHIIEMNWRTRPIRDPKILKGHDDHVITCLQFSGNRIVSGSDDNTLKVWSAVSGKCLRTLIGHTGGVWSSQMAGNVIISGSTDRTLKVWDMETGQCIHTLLGHTSTVRCMHLHGKKVVSGSRDATLRVWDIEQGTCLHVLVGHLAAVRCVQYDGKLIVSGAYDYMVKIWHPERQECLHTLQGHTNRVYSLQFDGIHVVSGSLDTSIRVWDAETGNSKHTLMGHQSLTSGMELRSNILVSGNADSTVKVWDITTGQCLQTLSGPNKHQSAVTCLQFNSRFVITSSDDGTVKLWDVKTGEFIRNLVALDSGGSGGVVWRIRANDTKLICAVGSRNGTEETKLMVLDFDVEGACVKCS